MPITVCCQYSECKEVFDIRDSMAGRFVECPACGRTVIVGVPVHDAPIVMPAARGAAAPPPQIAAGTFVVVVLWFVLQLGDRRSGWSQLE